MLTIKQRDLLTFIHERVKETGVSPSFDEMKLALDLKSKSGIHRLIMALEERGFLRRLPNRARAIEIIRMPETFSPGSHDISTVNKGFSPSVIEGNLGKIPTNTNGNSINTIIESNTSSAMIPILGRIAAGTPIEAIQTHDNNIAVPVEMLGTGEHFALEVRGDSMIDAGILEGDIVIILKLNRAENGDIVVALIDDHEATLKRYRKKGNAVALEAANPTYETRIFGAEHVVIQGKLIGLIRSY